MTIRASLLAALALLGLFFVYNKEEPSPLPAQSPPSSLPVPSKTSPPTQAKTSVPPLSRPPVTPETDALLASLRQSYLPSGSKGTRFKSQRALDQLWAQEPPTDLILFEALDANAPAEFRAHFAQRLRNIGKSLPPAQKETLSAAIRQALNSPHYPASIKAPLCGPLIAFSDSEDNLRVVAGLVPDAPDDQTTASLLAALTASKSPLSEESLQLFAAEHATRPDARRQSFQVVLPPLLLLPDPKIESSVEQIITHTRDPVFLQFTLTQLFSRPPGPGTISLVSLALAQGRELAPESTAQLQSLASRGLDHWTRKTTLSPDLASSLDQLKETLTR